MSRFTKRPAPVTVIATVAWFVAVGGVAAALPGKNSVDNSDVKGLKYKDLDLQKHVAQVRRPNRLLSASGGARCTGFVHLRGAIQQEHRRRQQLRATATGIPSGRKNHCARGCGRWLHRPLSIDPSGEAYADGSAGTSQANVQGFTSLDGDTYEAGK
jgi:hypothetical protein